MDLNLLVVLDSLLQTQNLTRTAERLARSPSAVSHALSRLRELFGDPLLVRTGTQMLPTDLAAQITPRVRSVVSELEALMVGRAGLDLSRLERKFVVGIADYAEPLVLPAVLRRIAKEAPGVDVQIEQVGDDVDRAVQSGRHDLAVGTNFRPLGGLLVQKLFDDRFVTVMRAGHPLAKQRLTLKRYLAARHGLVTPRGLPGGVVDRALDARGESRRVAYRTPHFLVALDVAASTELLVTIPRRLAEHFSESRKLVLRSPPVELLPFSVGMIYREAQRADPTHRWLRACFADAHPARIGRP